MGLVQLAKHNKEAIENGEAVFETSLHRLFLGNPGTGKTTVAKLYGKLLCELGFLSSGEVIVMDASELTGAHEGATEQKVNDLLHSAAGKVLVIDEAYVLAKSHYGREVLDVLVGRVQGTPGEDFAVILCGYKKEMRSMLRCNPGIARRFALDDAFHFADYSDEELTIIMQRQAASYNVFVSEEVARSVVQKVLSKQRARPNFGNAGAATNLLKRGQHRWMLRASKNDVGVVRKDGKLLLIETDLVNANDLLRLESEEKDEGKMNTVHIWLSL